MDQQGILITHSVFPGNTADISTIEGMSTRLEEEFGIDDMLLIVDQGMISDGKIAFFDEKGYDYLVSTGLKKDVVERAWHGEWGVIDKKTEAFVCLEGVTCHRKCLRMLLAYQLRSVMSHILKSSDAGMNIEVALDYLQSIKVVEIRFTGERAEVVRKVTNLDERQSLLVEVFNLKEEVERII